VRRLSLRTRTLIISTVFAALIAGGTSLGTYLIVVEGMRHVASNAATRAAQTANSTLLEAIDDVTNSASIEPTGQAGAVATRQLMLDRFKVDFAGSSPNGSDVALYDERLKLLWASSPRAAMSAMDSQRIEVQEAGLSGETVVVPQNALLGLFSDVRLSVLLTSIPVDLPGGSGTGVLDVVYTPTAEEAILNEIRRPMLILTVVSMALMIMLMQTSMAWVLGLVDNLRRGADSIDAGRLDERLPVKGQDEIAALAQSVNGLIERLERRSDAQARFVADASHELATPVAGIRGYTSILRAWGADDPRVRDEAVDAIDRESRRMARLTGDLLNLLHADQGLVLKTERFDLNALSRQQLATSASRWLDKNIEYVGPDDAPLAMVGDPDRVEDVMSILLDNASKYTPVGGRISVTTRRRREVVTFEVADTGQGIPEKDLPRVFDRFYRSEQSRASNEGGFGLGLAIAKSIVVSMGGEIAISSELGRGTTFSVKLPRGRA